MEKIGDTIGKLPLPKTPSLSERRCVCGKPCKVEGSWCETCHAERKKQKRIDEIRRQRKDKAVRLKVRLVKVIPPLFIAASLRDLSGRLKEVMLGLPGSKGLFLSGGAGVGKSYAMAALMRRFIVSGLSVRRVQWDELCLEIRDSFGGNGSELNTLKPYFKCDKLLIEDVGTTVSLNVQETDFSLRTLLLILDKRVEACKATFITSNRTPEQLGKSFDKRIESRIYACCEIRAVTGKDKRRIKD